MNDEMKRTTIVLPSLVLAIIGVLLIGCEEVAPKGSGSPETQPIPRPLDPQGPDWSFAIPTQNDSGVTLSDVAWNGGRFVAVGTNDYDRTKPETLLSGIANRIVYSSDGETWTDVITPYPIEEIRLTRVTAIGTGFLAGGYGGAAYSPDGVTWIVRRIGAKEVWDAHPWIGIWQDGARCSQSLFIEAGLFYFEHESFPTTAFGYGFYSGVRRSDDGITWEGGFVESRTDGMVSIQGLPSEYDAVACTEDHLIAVGGSGGSIAYSTDDGTTWVVTLHNRDETVSAADDSWSAFNAITVGGLHGDTFVAVGGNIGHVDGGITAASSDGIRWSYGIDTTLTPLSTSKPDAGLHDVIWTGEKYVAVGHDGNRNALVLQSSEGIGWIEANAPDTHVLLAVAGDRSRLVAVGEFGIYVRSEDSMR